MPDKVRIALDAMGGDHGASVVLPGADISLTRHPDIEFLLFGDRAVVEPLLEGLPRLKANARVVHTDVAIRMDDKPSQALRHGRWKSSMWLAIDAVKKGEADVAVSAGNTGALMAMARFNLKMIEGIERPAIAALWPTLKGESVVLDVGASIGADAASGQSRRHGQRHGARAVRHRAADRGPAQYRRRGGQGPRAGARGRPHPARGPFPAFRLSRLRRRRRYRQGHGRRGRDRRLCRQYRAEDRRRHRPPVRAISQRRHEPNLGRAARLSAGAPGVPHAARQDGPAQVQWRRLPRPQRHRHQEPRRRRCRRLRRRHRHRLRHGALRIARQDRRVDGARPVASATARVASGAAS